MSRETSVEGVEVPRTCVVTAPSEVLCLDRSVWVGPVSPVTQSGSETLTLSGRINTALDCEQGRSKRPTVKGPEQVVLRVQPLAGVSV